MLTVAVGGFASRGASQSAGPVEHARGIYLQQAIEIATVGPRVVRLTRMTRFTRCGRFRGAAQDFNGHLVDAVGRDVPGIGFVAGTITAIEGCPQDRGGETGTETVGPHGQPRRPARDALASGRAGRS
jgi:hypothetical protein